MSAEEHNDRPQPGPLRTQHSALRTGGTRRKGPRQKHVPQRTCVACRETGAKRALIRLVRTPEGTVEVDPTGKRNGRGAYLCARVSCWERGVNERTLGRALRLEALTQVNRDALLKYADERVPVE
jgi:hypothetical protein